MTSTAERKQQRAKAAAKRAYRKALLAARAGTGGTCPTPWGLFPREAAAVRAALGMETPAAPAGV